MTTSNKLPLDMPRLTREYTSSCAQTCCIAVYRQNPQLARNLEKTPYSPRNLSRTHRWQIRGFPHNLKRIRAEAVDAYSEASRYRGQACRLGSTPPLISSRMTQIGTNTGRMINTPSVIVSSKSHDLQYIRYRWNVLIGEL